MANKLLTEDIDLLGRVENGASLTTAQGDANKVAVEEHINGIKDALTVSMNNDGTFKDNTIQAAAIQLEAFGRTYAEDDGAANAYEVEFTPAFTDMADLVGIPLYIKAENTSTSACTLEVDGLGAEDLQYYSEVAVAAGDIQGGQIFVAMWDGTIFQFLGTVAPIMTNAPAALSAFRELKIINNSGSPNTQLDITIAEVCLRSATGRNITKTLVTKTLDMAAAAAVNGRETGLSESASTWYYVWLAVSADGATTGSFLSASATALDISAISGWSGDIYKILIGAVFNDGSSNLISIFQTNNRVSMLEQAVFDGRSAAVANTYEAIAGADLTAFRAAVPPNAKTFFGTFGSSSAQNSKVALAATAPTATTGIGAVSVAGTAQGDEVNGFSSSAPFELPMVTYLFYFKAQTTGAESRVVISGWTW